MQCKNNDFDINVFTAATCSARILLSVYESLRPSLSEPADYYPGFHAWYGKIYSQLILGHRAIITAHRKNKLVGFTILKNTLHENKICTFRIDKPYRGNKLASVLMLAALEMFQFRNVLITIPDFCNDSFIPLMNSAMFMQICKKNNAYVKNHAEFFYILNPQIPLCSYAMPQLLQ